MSDNLVKFFLDAKERVIKVEIDGNPSKLATPSHEKKPKDSPNAFGPRMTLNGSMPRSRFSQNAR